MRSAKGAQAARRPHLPVAMASGLAVGVLSGLLALRVGMGGPAVAGAQSDDPPEEAEPTRAQKLAADAATATTTSRVESSPDAGPSAEPDAGPPDAGSEETLAEAQNEQEDAERSSRPRVREVTLRFDVEPPEAPDVSITVDGEAVSERAHVVKVQGRRRRVQVVVRARGFLTWSREVRVGRDRELNIELERPRPTDDGPGGLIDL